MSDSITITIDDQQIETQPGQMLIDVADANNITIPRFCYHKKLSVAANCRMCLVEVEKAPKPMPACATPVNDGMVVRTRSKNAIAAQKSTMEFLLINHPLDCPICDQGGECELQDVAMGFGGDVSRYTERKRVVRDKNIGPLIATDMTRCIHCTRCVRFGEEIAGLPELGATGRGENVEIGTYIEKSVSSELSGNVIDLCPVGALTAKPSRYTARPWELVQHATVAPHDGVGSNLFAHTRNMELMRVVPRDNESINESWISDRDRFSYAALKSPARLTRPMQRVNGKLKQISWDDAITLVVEKCQAAGNNDSSIAALVSPQATLEEHYLLHKLIRGLGSANIDHRLKQVDFSIQDQMPVMPWLGRSIESFEHLDSALLVGANLRTEQPILNHRLRKAVVNKGAEVSSISTLADQYNYNLLQDLSGSAEQVVHDLAAVCLAVAESAKQDLPGSLTSKLEKVSAKKEHKAIASCLIDGDQSALVVGLQAVSHDHYGLILQLAESIAQMTQSSLSIVSESANAAGACLAGCLPNRSVAGQASEKTGENVQQILSTPHQVLLTFGIDPILDIGNGSKVKSGLEQQDFIIAIASFENDYIRETADLVLPLASFLETSGTYVNVEGLWQSFKGCCAAAGESRQGWKILTALARLLLPNDDYSYADSRAVRDELKELCRDVELNNFAGYDSSQKLPTRPRSVQRISELAIYSCDEICRNSQPLQATVNMQQATAVRINQAQAEKLGLADAEQVHVEQDGGTAILSLVIDASVPAGCAWIPAGVKAVENLGAFHGSITLEKLS